MPFLIASITNIVCVTHLGLNLKQKSFLKYVFCAVLSFLNLLKHVLLILFITTLLCWIFIYYMIGMVYITLKSRIIIHNYCTCMASSQEKNCWTLLYLISDKNAHIFHFLQVTRPWYFSWLFLTKFDLMSMELLHIRSLEIFSKQDKSKVLELGFFLLPLRESVIVLCFVVRYFISILVLQSS